MFGRLRITFGLVLTLVAIILSRHRTPPPWIVNRPPNIFASEQSINSDSSNSGSSNQPTAVSQNSSVQINSRIQPRPAQPVNATPATNSISNQPAIGVITSQPQAAISSMPKLISLPSTQSLLPSATIKLP